MKVTNYRRNGSGDSLNMNENELNFNSSSLESEENKRIVRHNSENTKKMTSYNIINTRNEKLVEDMLNNPLQNPAFFDNFNQNINSTKGI